MLVELFDLRDPTRLPTTAAGKGFLVLLKESEHAFQEVSNAYYLAWHKVVL